MAEFGIDSNSIVGLTTTTFGIIVIAFSFAYKIITDRKDKKILIDSHQKLINNIIATDNKQEEKIEKNKESIDKLTEVVTDMKLILHKMDDRIENLEKKN